MELVQKEADFVVSSLFSAFVRPVFLFLATMSCSMSPWKTADNKMWFVLLTNFSGVIGAF